MAIAVSNTELSVQNLNRRMSFHFGNVHVTEGPQICLKVTVDVDDSEETGVSMGALAPMWFYKNPDMTLESGIEDMLSVFEKSCDLAIADTAHADPFTLWKSLYSAVGEWASDTSYPPLLWSYGVSLVEQAVIDAYCKATETTFCEAVYENTLGIDLGSIYPELEDRSPVDLLPSEPVHSTAVRHTVGLSDPITVEDIEPENRLNDGLPQALIEYIEQQGVDHFKIKLSATESDANRLRRIHRVLRESRLDDYAFSLDANEQYDSVSSFREQWESMQSDDDLAAFFEHLLYVEQPLPRDQAFSEATRTAFDEWSTHPPIIIDESDDHLTSLETALECGYAGTSHKNCKGVFKGLVNRCLLEHRRQQSGDDELLMSGEDLTTLGPIELQEDLVVMGVLGMEHVERNGHHYYRGLSMLPEATQREVLENHGDLFRQHEQGFPTLDIQDGRISLTSVLNSPFGHSVNLETDAFTPVSEWSVKSIVKPT